MNLGELGLRDLEQEIRVYRQSTLSAEGEGKSLSDLEAYWTEVLYRVERIIEESHRFRSLVLTERMLAYIESGLSPDEIPKLRLQTAEPIVDLRRLRTKLSESGKALEERASVALSVAEVVIDQVNKVQMVASGTGKTDVEPFWPAELLHLANGYSDVPVCQPCGDPEIIEGADPARTEVGQLWKAVLDLSEGGGVALTQQLKRLEPPLTWAEVLYHFLRSLEDQRGEPVSDKRRREISKYMSRPSQTYCLVCHRLFTLDSRHLGRFVCPVCNATHRKRRQRQREGQATSQQGLSLRRH